MNYEQKRLVVRVFLPGPPEKVVDWEAVARELLDMDHLHESYLEASAKKHTTERPSRVDTGVDVVIRNYDDGSIGTEFPDGTLYLYPRENDETLTAPGFPTEPQEVVETQAEGEVSP
jgi:hypothetical protein